MEAIATAVSVALVAEAIIVAMAAAAARLLWTQSMGPDQRDCATPPGQCCHLPLHERCGCPLRGPPTSPRSASPTAKVLLFLKQSEGGSGGSCSEHYLHSSLLPKPPTWGLPHDEPMPHRVHLSHTLRCPGVQRNSRGEVVWHHEDTASQSLLLGAEKENNMAPSHTRPLASAHANSGGGTASTGRGMVRATGSVGVNGRGHMSFTVTIG